MERMAAGSGHGGALQILNRTGTGNDVLLSSRRRKIQAGVQIWEIPTLNAGFCNAACRKCCREQPQVSMECLALDQGRDLGITAEPIGSFGMHWH